MYEQIDRKLILVGGICIGFLIGLVVAGHIY